MRILFVVPYVPSLVRVRPYNLIRHLTARGHRVTVATVWTNDRERQEVEELERHCAEVHAVRVPAWRSLGNCLQAVYTGEPLQARYSWSADLFRQVSRLSTEADVVHVEHLRGARYGLLGASEARPSVPPVVWDSVDCISDLFEQAICTRRDTVGRLINRFELSRTRRFEGWAVSHFERVLVTSALDRTSLLELSGAWQGATNGTPLDESTVTVLPNGVDLGYFTPDDSRRDANTIVFSGKMSYHANETAVLHLVRDIMPQVWARRASVQLVVVGKDPSGEIRRVLAENPQRVTLTGTVPDVRPYLRRAAVAVAPLVYGVGCQNKVLEAMACATPVVATPRAVAALQTQSGLDVLVAEPSDAFADAIVALVDDPLRRLSIGRAGRAYVNAHHRWDTVATHLEAIYAQLLAARQHESSARHQLLPRGASAALVAS
jgi:polysaccharide biosynthesis protein PslH